jgi:hypothetical protein
MGYIEILGEICSYMLIIRDGSGGMWSRVRSYEEEESGPGFFSQAFT